MLQSQLRRRTRLYQRALSDEDADVIDLGAPPRVVRIAKRRRPAPRPRALSSYVPNPRLYPGPKKPKYQRKQSAHSVRRKNLFCKPVPNSRLYRPAPPRPPRPPPPPPVPRTTWRPVPPALALETASQVALRLSLTLGRKDRKPRSPVRGRNKRRVVKKSARASGRTRRTESKRTRRSALLKSKHSSNKRAFSPAPYAIALPAAGDGHAQKLSRSPSPSPHQHFIVRDNLPISCQGPLVIPTGIMDATQRHSASPEDCSDGNDSLSAPSEFLAEFLSAIMQRQYAEALKYCRLILQYEPHNATARGFYPLLRQKLGQAPREARPEPALPRSPRLPRDPRSRAGREPDSVSGGALCGGNSGESTPTSQPPSHLPHEVMELETDSLSCSVSEASERRSAASTPEPEPGLGSVSSQSSLELDSSPSMSLSRRTDRTDHSSSLSASGTWDSSAGSTRDDNGNPAPPPSHSTCDAENNSHTAAAAPRSPLRTRPLTLQSEQSSESLRRLRAQFACSIK